MQAAFLLGGCGVVEEDIALMDELIVVLVENWGCVGICESFAKLEGGRKAVTGRKNRTESETAVRPLIRVYG